MLAVAYTRSQGELQPSQVSVEVHIQSGLPAINIIGLPETAVKESRDRVRSSLLQNGFYVPDRRITINLAPADLPKFGTHYDLAIAIALLVASGQLRTQLDQFEFFGELTLAGGLRTNQAIVPALMCPHQQTVIIPHKQQHLAANLAVNQVLCADHLQQVVRYLRSEIQLQPPQIVAGNIPPTPKKITEWSDIRGQERARKAAVIAASGGHSMLLLGPPGCGKSLLANAFIGILPKLTQQQFLQTVRIHALAQGEEINWHDKTPPFRQPHHTSSAVALIGGGTWPKPGEISLAHNGVLFLDELPEFRRDTLEALREPLETAKVRISRSNKKVTFPAKAILMAAMNPCPCGYLGEPRCNCSEEQIKKYRNKLSGPLLDRIDMHVEMHPVSVNELMNLPTTSTSSAQICQHVTAVRQRQITRQNKLNHQLTVSELDKYAKLNDDCQQLLQQAMERLKLSARAYHRILRLSRTIADNFNRDDINTDDIRQAVGYRLLDRR